MPIRKGSEIRAIINNRVDDGVKIFGRDDVSDIKADPGSDFLVSNASDEYNKNRRFGGPRRSLKYSPFELKLPQNEEIEAAVKWLGKSVVDRFGYNFVMVDTTKSIAFDRATEQAQNRVRNLGASGVGFSFFIKAEFDVDEEKIPIIQSLREGVVDLGLPTIDIGIVRTTPEILDAQEDDSKREALAVESSIIIPPSDIYIPE